MREKLMGLVNNEGHKFFACNTRTTQIEFRLHVSVSRVPKFVISTSFTAYGEPGQVGQPKLLLETEDAALYV